MLSCKIYVNKYWTDWNSIFFYQIFPPGIKKNPTQKTLRVLANFLFLQIRSIKTLNVISNYPNPLDIASGSVYHFIVEWEEVAVNRILFIRGKDCLRQMSDYVVQVSIITTDVKIP